jgi:uncharacterized protein (DUF111 family)
MAKKSLRRIAMNLFIDARGGVAGDMLCAGLLALGADADRVLGAMESLGSFLGEASVTLAVQPDGVNRLSVSLENNDKHLAAGRARQFLECGLVNLGLPEPYLRTGRRALEILIEAEGEAHRQMPEMDHHIHGHHAHNHHHHNHDHHHHNHAEDAHEHAHGHEPTPRETFLHEAQDIVLDIGGVMTALWCLDCPPQITLLHPLSAGGGEVSFSHGTLAVPAPAARIILERFAISWQHGPIDQELCTPTGLAILAALGAGKVAEKTDLTAARRGLSRGTRPYNVPPLAMYLV